MIMKKQAITIGRIGILIPIASIIPVLGGLAGLAAIVLFMISHYYFSKVYEQPVVFRSALTGSIITVATSIIGSVMILLAVGFTAFSFSGNDFQSLEYQKIIDLVFASGATITGAIIILAGMIIGLYFVFKALGILAEQSNVKLFRIAGLLYFIGAIATILFFIGFLVIFVAWIIHIVAYFSIVHEKEAEQTAG